MCNVGAVTAQKLVTDQEAQNLQDNLLLGGGKQ